MGKIEAIIRNFVEDYLKKWGGHHGILAMIALFIMSRFGIHADVAAVIPIVYYYSREFDQAQRRAQGDGKYNFFGAFRLQYWEKWDILTPSIVSVIHYGLSYLGIYN